MNTPVAVDSDNLGKLLCLAKSLDDAFRDNPKSRAVERVLIRTTSEGTLTFQVKGGHLWRFFAITLSGREQEYDLGKNFASLQNLFHSLSCQTESEIRRAAQGMAMYKETVIDTRDAVATLQTLEQTLNSLIDYILAKKLGRITDEERKKSIKEALEAMKICFQPQKARTSLSAREPKRQSKKKVASISESNKPFEETFVSLESRIAAKKETYPYEAAYLQGRVIALQRCKKELVLWLQGESTPARELLDFRNVKNLLNEWDRASPELSQLKQQAHDLSHTIESALATVRERLEKLQTHMQPVEAAVKKQFLFIDEKLSHLLQEKNEGLEELFRQAGEHYLIQPQQFSLDLQAVQHAIQNRKKQLTELEDQRSMVEKELLAQPTAVQVAQPVKEKKSPPRKKTTA